VRHLKHNKEMMKYRNMILPLILELRGNRRSTDYC